MTTREQLKRLGACPEAVEWASSYPTIQAAWEVCERGDWMLWFLSKIGGHDDAVWRLMYSFADRAVRMDAVAALRSAAGADGMPSEHAVTLRQHADKLEALPSIDSRAATGAARDAAWAARAAAWAARDAAWAARSEDHAEEIRREVPSVEGKS